MYQRETSYNALKLNSFLNQEHDKNVENAHAHVLRNMKLDRPMISPQTSVFPVSVAVLLLGLLYSYTAVYQFINATFT